MIPSQECSAHLQQRFFVAAPSVHRTACVFPVPEYVNVKTSWSESQKYDTPVTRPVTRVAVARSESLRTTGRGGDNGDANAHMQRTGFDCFLIPRSLIFNLTALPRLLYRHYVLDIDSASNMESFVSAAHTRLNQHCGGWLSEVH